MSEINVVVIGAGFIGPVHVEALKRIGINVQGILSSTPEKSVLAAQKLGLPKAYKTLQELLLDESVHSVHITTPNHLHFEMARAALNAGKHVLCDKPLAMNSTESAELVRLAGKKGLVAGVCYNTRFYPLNLQARQMIESGEVGEIYAINGCYLQDWLLFDTDYNWRVRADQGGPLCAVADIGTHWMDLVSFISQMEIEAVFADLLTTHKTRQRPMENGQTEPVNVTTDDHANILLRFKSGARGNLTVSQVTAGKKNQIRYEIAGSRCSLGWDSQRPNELKIGYRNRANACLLKDPSLVSKEVQPFISYPGGHNEGFSDTFKQCFRAFYDYIAAGDFNAKPTFPTFADGHHEILLCEAILKSHQDHKWVKV